ncbi:probable high CO2 inducible periplasmic protein [Ectocarpus siliculosus]|uniref:Probable high CO2 inducible periplasmic protein n=1 Tax=Ectocarpus siliculosus TaxID=2880 RepID=D8LFX4_ECTSI|nr:probable high CO2 inducible periplasmic protein [Ectocarpus siliculosus]|eukprot:CBN78873.1 probable high CO2 inducible periplasmic protein [Ectocarpus siliculosus]
MSPSPFQLRCALLVLAAVTRAAVASYDDIAGYTPVSDVVEHSELDLDMQELEEGADLQTDAGFAAAYTAYSVGGNSEKTDSIRTIQGFSTGAQEKLSGEKWFDVYEAYWGSTDYADQFTSGACNGTEQFDDASVETRAEGCVKGAQYQNVWMYVIHELEDAIEDCDIGNLNANDGGPHAWDEGWGFYAGSLEGTEGTGDGVMLYALAEKRCENFATCTADDDGSDITGTAQVNSDMLELYKEGQVYLLDGDCGAAGDVKDKIIDLMGVPLVQGMLRYFYNADPEAGDGGDKAAAELWAFSAAMLPRINECDEEVATLVRANTDIASADAPMSEGYVFLKEQLESVYSCMGISCSQVGGLVIGESTTYYDGFEPCGDSDSGLSQIALGFIIAAGAVVLAVGLGCFYRSRKNKEKMKAAMESDLGGFGASKSVGTL